MAPHEAALKVQAARIAEVQHAARHLELRAPYSGTIVSITAEPGQSVRQGDPIVTIAARHGRYVIGYLRQHEGRQTQPRDLVEVRAQSLAASAWTSEVEEIGPQYEAIPPRLLRDPRLPEWGLPIRIAITEPMTVRPGELLNLAFVSRSKASGR